MESKDSSSLTEENREYRLGCYLVLLLCDFRDRTSLSYMSELRRLARDLLMRAEGLFRARSRSLQLEQIEEVDHQLEELDSSIDYILPDTARDYLLPLYSARLDLVQENQKLSELLELLCDKNTGLWDAVRRLRHELGHMLAEVGGTLFHIREMLLGAEKSRRFVLIDRMVRQHLIEGISDIDELLRREPGLILDDDRKTLFYAYYKTDYHKGAAQYLRDMIRQSLQQDTETYAETSREEALERLNHQLAFFGEEPHVTPLLALLRALFGREEAERLLVDNRVVSDLLSA